MNDKFQWKVLSAEINESNSRIISSSKRIIAIYRDYEKAKIKVDYLYSQDKTNSKTYWINRIK